MNSKVLKGCRLRLDQILDNIICKEYNNEACIEIDGVTYNLDENGQININKEK